VRRHQRWSCRTATYWRPRTPLPRPSRPQRCENRLARAINSGHEGMTIVQNQGARRRSHRRGIPHTQRASQGAWARSQHHLDHTQEELQNLWPVRRHHQSHAGGTTAACARPGQNPRIHRRKNRRVVRPQQHATKTICRPSDSQAGRPDPPERNEGGQGDRELEKQFNFDSSQLIAIAEEAA
jgi:hypothetical protein